MAPDYFLDTHIYPSNLIICFALLELCLEVLNYLWFLCKYLHMLVFDGFSLLSWTGVPLCTSEHSITVS